VGKIERSWARFYNYERQADAVHRQKEGHFPVEKLCKVYDYKDMETALHDLHEGKVTKPVIKWS
jgi:Zn-dependent alcohol dehydrogenase